MSEKNLMLGVDNKPGTCVKFDAFILGKLTSVDGKRGRRFL